MNIVVRKSSTVAKPESLIPPLSRDLHKGSCGRVVVVGGSDAYSGAPFLAAMAAARAGTDLVSVVCPPTVAPIIKAYSPDLVVRGIYSPETMPDCVSVVERAHAVLIGPGLGELAGRSSMTLAFVQSALSIGKPVIIDADGLHCVPFLWPMTTEETTCSEARGSTQQRKGRLVLTPNAMELNRLAQRLGVVAAAKEQQQSPSHLPVDSSIEPSPLTATVPYKILSTLADRMSFMNAPGPSPPPVPLSVAIITKGPQECVIAMDTDTRQVVTIEQDTEGSLRRVSGQGDVLAGLTAAFAAWELIREAPAVEMPQPGPGVAGVHNEQRPDSDSQGDVPSSLLLRHAEHIVGASTVMRRTQRVAHERMRRSFIASDLLGLIGDAFAA